MAGDPIPRSDKKGGKRSNDRSGGGCYSSKSVRMRENRVVTNSTSTSTDGGNEKNTSANAGSCKKKGKRH